MQEEWNKLGISARTMMNGRRQIEIDDCDLDIDSR
jgi:hypothetical protein